MYLFVVRPHGININVAEESFATIAYSLEDAQTAFQTAYKHREKVSGKLLGTKPVSTFLELIGGKEAQPPPKTKKQFVEGLKLAADKFVKNERDKKSILRILSTI